jgi:hypothetical protein
MHPVFKAPERYLSASNSRLFLSFCALFSQIEGQTLAPQYIDYMHYTSVGEAAAFPGVASNARHVSIKTPFTVTKRTFTKNVG